MTQVVNPYHHGVVGLIDIIFQKTEPNTEEKAVPSDTPLPPPAVTATVVSANQPAASATTSQWKATAFAQDQDGKMAAKFRKLMGIKKEGEDVEVDNSKEETDEQQKRQEELFSRLDKEYEFARMATHTHRGVGLGFQSMGLPD